MALPLVPVIFVVEGDCRLFPAATRAIPLGRPLDLGRRLALVPSRTGKSWWVHGEGAEGFPVAEPSGRWDVEHQKGHGFSRLNSVRSDRFASFVALALGPDPGVWPRPAEEGAFALAAAYVLGEGERPEEASRWLDLARRGLAQDTVGLEGERQAARRGAYDREVRAYDPATRQWHALRGETLAVRLPERIPLGRALALAPLRGVDELSGDRGWRLGWATPQGAQAMTVRCASLAALGGAWAGLLSPGDAPLGGSPTAAVRVLAEGEDPGTVERMLAGVAPGRLLGDLPDWRWPD